MTSTTEETFKDRNMLIEAGNSGDFLFLSCFVTDFFLKN